MPRARVLSLDEEDASPHHDDLVMQAVDSRRVVLSYAWDQGWISGFSALTSLYLIAEVEHHVSADEAGPRVDVALFDRDLEIPLLLLEIKSKRENQSASSWTSQIRGYEKFSGVPCVLVVAHDLSPAISRYLKFANIKIVDVRNLK